MSSPERSRRLVLVPCGIDDLSLFENVERGDSLLSRMPFRKRVKKLWHQWGFELRFLNMNWKVPGHFEDKAQEFIAGANELEKDFYLLGLSAGGTASVCFAGDPRINSRIRGVATVVSPLAMFPAIELTRCYSPALYEVVLRSQQRVASLSGSDRARLLTVRTSGDAVVPFYAATIQGAKDLQLKRGGHISTMLDALQNPLAAQIATHFLNCELDLQQK